MENCADDSVAINDCFISNRFLKDEIGEVVCIGGGGGTHGCWPLRVVFIVGMPS